MDASDTSGFRKKMCVVFRKERKAIIRSHVCLAQYLIGVLKKSKELQTKLMHGEKLGDCHLVFKKLYMAPQDLFGEFECIIDDPLEDTESDAQTAASF